MGGGGGTEELPGSGQARAQGLSFSGLQAPHPSLGLGINSPSICLASIY